MALSWGSWTSSVMLDTRQCPPPNTRHQLYYVTELGLAERSLLGKASKGGPELLGTSLRPRVRCYYLAGAGAPVGRDVTQAKSIFT